MTLTLVAFARAHDTGVAHVHSTSPAALLVLVAWFLLAATWWRRVAT